MTKRPKRIHLCRLHAKVSAHRYGINGDMAAYQMALCRDKAHKSRHYCVYIFQTLLEKKFP